MGLKSPIITSLGTIVCLIILSACGGTEPAGSTDNSAAPGSADLAPHIPPGWTSPIMFDQDELFLKVSWTNNGTAMGENYYIALLVDGQVVEEWWKPVIAPGSVKTRKIELTEFLNPQDLISGLRRLELIVDSHGNVAESDESNNSYSTIRELVLALPDLEPLPPRDLHWDSPVVFGGAALVYGERQADADSGYFMAYSLTNSGEGPAKSWGLTSEITLGNLKVRPYHAKSTGDTKPSPGQVLVSAIPIWKITVLEGPLLIGEHRFEWTIDSGNSVTESDEDNNSLSISVEVPASRERTTTDRPDDSDFSVHLAYVLPADGDDEQWDINGTIESIVGSIQTWLRERANGLGLRFDTYSGELDITFLRLNKTKDEVAEVVVTSDAILSEMIAAGFDNPTKIYAVWYPQPGRGGTDISVCGFQTSRQGVRFAFSFFERMEDPQPNRCVNQDTTMLHEVFHALGAVSPCVRANLNPGEPGPPGHVDDDPNDLMYQGTDLRSATALDKDRDDYFGHDVAQCFDLADSKYLEQQY